MPYTADMMAEKKHLRIFPALLPALYRDNQILYNLLVTAGCGVLFVAILLAGSLLGEIAVILIMFLTSHTVAARFEMGWMAILLLVPVAVFVLDSIFCILLLVRNLHL